MFKGNTGGAGSFFDAEAKINRRLKNNPAVASFQGVAGDGVYLVWKYEGLDTLGKRKGRKKKKTKNRTESFSPLPPPQIPSSPLVTRRLRWRMQWGSQRGSQLSHNS